MRFTIACLFALIATQTEAVKINSTMKVISAEHDTFDNLQLSQDDLEAVLASAEQHYADVVSQKSYADVQAFDVEEDIHEALDEAHQQWDELDEDQKHEIEDQVHEKEAEVEEKVHEVE